MHTLSVRDLRIFVAVPRTASTLFMRVMAQNPAVGVTSRNILMGNMVPRPADPAARRPFRPDYSIFEPGHPIYEIAAKMGKRIIVSKEEFGNDRFTGNEALNECNFPMFPNAAAIRATKPIFGFRRPEHAFDSWLSKGWSDLESFLLVYKTDLKTFRAVQALNPDTVFYTLEYRTRNARTQANVFKRICDYWGIAFDKKMLMFRDRFGENFLYRNEQERGIYASNPKGLFTEVMEAKGIRSNRRIPVSFNRTRHSGLPLSLGRLTRLFIGQRLGCMRETSITAPNSGAGQGDDYRLSSGRAVGRVRS